MEQAWKEWLQTDQIGRSRHADNTPAQKLKFPYIIYGCMLLLPPSAFESQEWREATSYCSPEDIERLYRLISRHLKVTHIAINRPIPALEGSGKKENIIRAPINFTPLYGNFGPTTCSSPPNQDDYDSAFWVTAKQNGIFQTWAPRWTMFSRGNISEKARLLSLPSVQQVVEEGRINGQGCAAVDLYAGIGYFAFSYLKAGFDKVLCWDLNPWSVEGLRRGVTANKWSTSTYSGNGGFERLLTSNAEILIFNESNEHASNRMQKIRCHLPPVRHVNCGLLPSSRASWQTALDVLDCGLGGWVHVHENFAAKEIEQKAQEVRKAFQEMVDKNSKGNVVKIEHTNRLKSYAPGVMHCVIDLYIPPSEGT